MSSGLVDPRGASHTDEVMFAPTEAAAVAPGRPEAVSIDGRRVRIHRSGPTRIASPLGCAQSAPLDSLERRPQGAKEISPVR